MYPKDFIQNVLIGEIAVLSETNPYITFALMAIGIEFLGKCLDTNEHDWNKGKSKVNFEKAINTLDSLEKYRKYLPSNQYGLWDSLRNGFAHSFVPKKQLGLSSKGEAEHVLEYTQNNIRKLNLKCEDLYIDFKGACIEVIGMNFASDNKMMKPLLSVPED